MDPEKVPGETALNVDKMCSSKSMFATKEKMEDFYTALSQACFLKNSCELDPERMLINQTISGTEHSHRLLTGVNSSLADSDPEGRWILREVKMSELISESCYRRIFDVEIATTEYIGVVLCISDELELPFAPGTRLHKEGLGLLAVIADLISLALMYYLFGKLKSVNEEYLRILDNNVIRMQDFSLQIRRLAVDDTSQDIRILKLKLWVHMTEILRYGAG